MSKNNFNQQNIELIEDKKLRALVTVIWKWEAKDGIKFIQGTINSLGANLIIDGWLGEKSIEAINRFGSDKVHGAIIYKLSELKEINEPNYITIAKKELGVKEIKGRKHSIRVLKYHSTTSG